MLRPKMNASISTDDSKSPESNAFTLPPPEKDKVYPNGTNRYEGKALIAATKQFTLESKFKGWWLLFVTLLVATLFISASVSHFHWLLRGFFSILAGLSIVRLFIFYHDFMHVAIFRGSKLAKGIMFFYGLLVMTPPRAWRDSHNYHHAHTAKIVGSHVGSYSMATLAMWSKMSSKERLMYMIIRHPLTIFMGYFTIFMYGFCISPFRRDPQRHWDSLVSLLLNWSITYFLISQYGFSIFFFGFFFPLFVACASGAYLFYAQHNAPDIHIQPRDEWVFARAALESSTYTVMGPIMRWFTGNIGYHHVHHLNPSIPFYRLPETMDAIPELQSPPKTSLRLDDIMKCLALKLWDPDLGHMVPFPSKSDFRNAGKLNI